MVAYHTLITVHRQCAVHISGSYKASVFMDDRAEMYALMMRIAPRDRHTGIACSIFGPWLKGEM